MPLLSDSDPESSVASEPSIRRIRRLQTLSLDDTASVSSSSSSSSSSHRSKRHREEETAHRSKRRRKHRSKRTSDKEKVKEEEAEEEAEAEEEEEEEEEKEEEIISPPSLLVPLHPPPSPASPPRVVAPHVFNDGVIPRDGQKQSEQEQEQEQLALVPVPPDEVDWERYIDDFHIPDPDWCFWCLYAMTKEHYANNKNVEEMVRYDEENREEVHPFVYAREMTRLYRENIKNYLIGSDGKPDVGPEWSGKTAWEHSSEHVVREKVVLEEWRRTITRGLRLMANNGMFLGEKGKKATVVDSKMFAQYTKTIKDMRPLFTGIVRNTALYGLK